MQRSDRSAGQARAFWGIATAVVAIDAYTKWWAVDALTSQYVPTPIVGEVVRLTWVYNRGAACGLSFGGASRIVFTLLTLAALVLLAQLHRSTRAGDWMRTLAVSLVCGGAVGNLMDRLKSPRGVVDFIDIGRGSMRWPTFNLADIAVSCGAVLLAIVLWREDRRHEAAREATNQRIFPDRADPRGHDTPIQG